jgi:sortase A
MKRPLIVVFALLAAGAAFLGRGIWIFAKAQVAQVLLAGAWETTRGGGHAVKPWPWADTWPVARLTVPRLGVEEIVLAGGHGEAMAFGPGHLGASSAPGSAGNVVLAGHRDTHFRFLRDLEPTRSGWRRRTGQSAATTWPRRWWSTTATATRSRGLRSRP